jgi:ribosomal protein S14
MPLEPLLCKKCGAPLDASLTCEHCGTKHERVFGKLQVCRVCPKHLLAYSGAQCPQCEGERQAHLKYLEERRKEGLQKVNEAKQKYGEWKNRNFPKLKKLSVVALLCLIIGIAGLFISTEFYMHYNDGHGFNTSIITANFGYGEVISSNSFPNGYVEITLVSNGISLTPRDNTITNSITDTLNTPITNDVIPFSNLEKGEQISIAYIGAGDDFTSETTLTINYIPTQAELNYLADGTPANLPLTFNQSLSVVSSSPLGILEILMIVAGIGIPICIGSEIWYESAEIGAIARLYDVGVNQ